MVAYTNNVDMNNESRIVENTKPVIVSPLYHYEE